MKAMNFYTIEIIHDQRRRKGRNQMKFAKFYPEKYEFHSFLTKARQPHDEKDEKEDMRRISRHSYHYKYQKVSNFESFFLILVILLHLSMNNNQGTEIQVICVLSHKSIHLCYVF